MLSLGCSCCRICSCAYIPVLCGRRRLCCHRYAVLVHTMLRRASVVSKRGICCPYSSSNNNVKQTHILQANLQSGSVCSQSFEVELNHGRCNDEVVGGTNVPQSYAAHAAAARSEAESGQCFMSSLACFHAF